MKFCCYLIWHNKEIRVYYFFHFLSDRLIRFFNFLIPSSSFHIFDRRKWSAIKSSIFPSNISNILIVSKMYDAIYFLILFCKRTFKKEKHSFSPITTDLFVWPSKLEWWLTCAEHNGIRWPTYLEEKSEIKLHYNIITRWRWADPRMTCQLQVGSGSGDGSGLDGIL